MKPGTIVKAFGVALFGYLFVHLWGMPMGLIAVAALAMVVLP